MLLETKDRSQEKLDEKNALENDDAADWESRSTFKGTSSNL